MTGTDAHFDETAFNVDPARVWGRLEAEEPCATASTVISGRCSVGAFSYLNHSCEIANADIGRYCSIGQRVLINPGIHRIDFLTTHPIGSDPSGVSCGLASYAGYKSAALTSMTRPQIEERTRIGSDVWIGAQSVIMPVQIGHGAIIGAGAVVTQDVEPYAIVGGVPARFIRWRFDESLRQRLLASCWWEYDLSVVTQRDYSDPIGFLALLEAAIERGASKRIKPRKRVYGA